jgi:hypothetical protein
VKTPSDGVVSLRPLQEEAKAKSKDILRRIESDPKFPVTKLPKLPKIP